MSRSHRMSLLLVCILLLSACGQKGPLFLPGNPTEVRSEVPSTNASTVPAGETDEEEKPDEQP